MVTKLKYEEGNDRDAIRATVTIEFGKSDQQLSATDYETLVKAIATIKAVVVKINKQQED